MKKHAKYFHFFSTPVSSLESVLPRIGPKIEALKFPTILVPVGKSGDNPDEMWLIRRNKEGKYLSNVPMDNFFRHQYHKIGFYLNCLKESPVAGHFVP